jgi:hypothetical protein
MSTTTVTAICDTTISSRAPQLRPSAAAGPCFSPDTRSGRLCRHPGPTAISAVTIDRREATKATRRESKRASTT